MIRRTLVVVCLTLGLSCILGSAAQENRTDPSRGVFVEDTATDFPVVGKLALSVNKYVVVFELSTPKAGDYTLVCAIDGRMWREEKKFKCPGSFRLNTRGLVSGFHRITLQLVDANGCVGSWTKSIDVK